MRLKLEKIANPQAFTVEKFVFLFFSIEIQPLYCFRGKILGFDIIQQNQV
jgi:hypothetical protein